MELYYQTSILGKLSMLFPDAPFVLLWGFSMSPGQEKKDNTPPQGFMALFNGKDLSNRSRRSIRAWLVFGE